MRRGRNSPYGEPNTKDTKQVRLSLCPSRFFVRFEAMAEQQVEGHETIFQAIIIRIRLGDCGLLSLDRRGR